MREILFRDKDPHRGWKPSGKKEVGQRRLTESERMMRIESLKRMYGRTNDAEIR